MDGNEKVGYSGRIPLSSEPRTGWLIGFRFSIIIVVFFFRLPGFDSAFFFSIIDDEQSRSRSNQIE